MPNPTDTLDITLLKNNKHEFILRCQRIIEFIVKHFVTSGMFPSDLFQDTVQSVNEELIKRLESIERNYNGSVLLTTYMNVVIRNICLRIHEQNRTRILLEPLTDDVESQNSDHLTTIMIQEEYRQLSLALRLFGAKREKIILCLKIYFRLSIPEQELRTYFTALSPDELAILQKRFSGNYDDTLEIDNFNEFAPFINRQEQNATSGGSLRRWTLEYLSRIIALMNGNPPVKAHTKDTIKILLEQLSQ